MKHLLPSLLGAFLGCGAFFLPGLALADEPEPLHRYGDTSAPPGPVRGKLFLAGAAVTTGFYLPVLGASYLWPDYNGAEQLRIPVAGPWMAFSKTKLCNARPESEQGDCNDFLNVTGAILIILDGIGQAGGVGLMLESIFLPAPKKSESAESKSTALVGSGIYGNVSAPPYSLGRHEAPRGPLTFGAGDLRITPVPLLGKNADLGLAFVGSF